MQLFSSGFGWMARGMPRRPGIVKQGSEKMKSKTGLFAIVLILATVTSVWLTAGPVVAAPDPQAGTRWIPFSGGASGKVTLDPVFSGHTRFEAEVSLGGMEARETVVGNRSWTTLSFPGGGHLATEGAPALPTLGWYLAVPPGAVPSVTFQILDQTVIDGFDVAPHQPPWPEVPGADRPAAVMNSSLYAGSTPYPAVQCELKEPWTVRGCDITLLTVCPVSYEPALRRLTVATRFSVSVTFDGAEEGIEILAPRFRSPWWEPFYQSFLANADILGAAPEWRKAPAGGNGGREAGCDLLIIAADEFVPGIETLAAWRHRTGLTTKVTPLSQIGSTSAAIRSYVSDAYYNWDTPPSFLLLVGDADDVPVNYLYNHPYHGSKTGTDLWYVAIDGGDYFPDIHSGRISVENSSELGVITQKILGYELQPDRSTNWFNRLLLAAYNESGRFFITTSEFVYDYLNGIGYDIDRQYQGGSPPGSTTGCLNAIEDGVIIAGHRDHGDSRNYGGSYCGWSHPALYTSHVSQMNNGWKLPIFLSIHCNSGWFDGETDSQSGNYECFGEEVTRASGEGGVGNIGSTRVSYSGYNDELTKGFYDAMWPGMDPDYPGGGYANPLDDPVWRRGAVMDFGKWWMYDKYIEPGGCPPYPWTPDETTSRCEFEMFHYFGDPAMEMWTAMPADASVEHSAAVPLGTSFLDVTVSAGGSPVEDALVCAMQTGEGGEYARAFTDAAGFARLTVTVANMDTLHVTATAHNVVAYRGFAMPISDEAYVSVKSWIVDDDDSGTSSGNGDGDVNPGESIELPVEVKNWGMIGADGVVGWLLSTDPYVTLTDDYETFGDLGPGDSTFCGDDYDFSVALDCPDGHAIQFELQVEDNASGSWISPISLSVKAPAVSIYDFSVSDPLPGGNGNGVAEPGESISLSITVYNDGSGTAHGIDGVLSAGGDPYVTITQAGSSFGDVAPGGYADSYPLFELDISPTVPESYKATLPLDMLSEEGYPFTDEMELTILPAVFFDDMEDGQGDWTHYEVTQGYNDEWHMETYRRYSGSYSWKCGGAGGADYDDYDDSGLVTPLMALPIGAVLTFYHWMDAELDSGIYAWDGAIVEISDDGGATWTQITPVGGYPYKITDNPASPFEPDTPCFSGSHTWKQETFELSAWSGIVQVRFRFGTDGYVTEEGWYIDDVLVTGSGGAVVVTLTPDEVSVPRGGTAGLTFQLENTGDEPETVDAWTELTLPNGQAYPGNPHLGPQAVTLAAGQTVSQHFDIPVPVSAPLGVYTYTGNAGDYPGTVFSTDSFDIEVTE